MQLQIGRRRSLGRIGFGLATHLWALCVFWHLAAKMTEELAASATPYEVPLDETEEEEEEKDKEEIQVQLRTDATTVLPLKQPATKSQSKPAPSDSVSTSSSTSSDSSPPPGNLSIGIDLTCVPALPELLKAAVDNYFDFLLIPLVHPRYQRNLLLPETNNQLPFTRPDTIFESSTWMNYIWGKISSWIELDSPHPLIRRNSESIFQQEVNWATHLSITTVLLPTPRADGCSNYAKILNTALQSTTYLNFTIPVSISLTATAASVSTAAPASPSTATTSSHSSLPSPPAVTDLWESWNRIKNLCEHHKRLSVTLILDGKSSLPSKRHLFRWLGEPLRTVILCTSIFKSNAKNYPVLSKVYQTFLFRLFDHKVNVILRGSSKFPNGLVPFQYYLRYLYSIRPVLSFQEQFEYPYRDFLQSPLQPLADNLESQTYETFEKDPIKYSQYEKAIQAALTDHFPVTDTQSSSPVVIMVVGAGRGPLVRCVIRAAAQTGHSVHIYAVEKNPNAVVTLRAAQLKEWGNMVEVISSDMRTWNAPQLADILVSELLGSFGDNELSPECLDGAQRFLKPATGISIPSASTSYLTPISSSKLWSEVKTYDSLKAFETSYVVKLHNIYDMATTAQPVFKFIHPNPATFPPTYNTLPTDLQQQQTTIIETKVQPAASEDPTTNGSAASSSPSSSSVNPILLPSQFPVLPVPAGSGLVDNSRYRRLTFHIPLAATLTGFAGYFDSQLYQDISISIYPKTFSTGMFSWFPIYFPLRAPLTVPGNTTLQVDFWRCVGGGKVWYEWAVAAPFPTAIHNPGGRSAYIGL